MPRKTPAILFFFLCGIHPQIIHAKDSSSLTEAENAGKVFCTYLNDVEAKTPANCSHEILTDLKTQDPAEYSRMLTLVPKRKTEVMRAYEFLRAKPPLDPKSAVTGNPDQSSPIQLQPPINERTFPAWIGSEEKDLKEVYARWLQAQNQELQREKESPVSPERGKEIAAALEANQGKISALERIKDPAELGCFLGETCGSKSGLLDPSRRIDGEDNNAWTKDDYERANTEAKRQSPAPGGKLDRVVPLGAIASEAADKTPLGLLFEKPEDEGQSGLSTATKMALAASGTLLLFGGLGGRQLEEKIPGIRRNMVIGVGILSASGAGAVAISEVSIPALTLAGPPAQQFALAGGGSWAGGAAVLDGAAVVSGAKVIAGTVITVVSAKKVSDIVSYTKLEEKHNQNAPDDPRDAGKRYLDDPESLRGADPQEVKDLIPKKWTRKPMRTGRGDIFQVPETKGSDYVQISNGNRASPDALHQGPYVKIVRHGKTFRIPLKGNVTLK